jgi:hypothetical protein
VDLKETNERGLVAEVEEGPAGEIFRKSQQQAIVMKKEKLLLRAADERDHERR